MASKKRLKRNSRGSIILPNGQRITPTEQKALRNAVNNANRIRKAMIEKLPSQAKERYKDFGISSDFVLRKKSASFNRFRNKTEFNRYLRATQNISQKSFIEKNLSTYRDNINRAIDRVFNSAGKPLKDFIKSLSNNELRELTLSESFNDIGYVYYAPVAVEEKLAVLTRQVSRIRGS